MKFKMYFSIRAPYSISKSVSKHRKGSQTVISATQEPEIQKPRGSDFKRKPREKLGRPHPTSISKLGVVVHSCHLSYARKPL
jgi:hypothetical protein